MRSLRKRNNVVEFTFWLLAGILVAIVTMGDELPWRIATGALSVVLVYLWLRAGRYVWELTDRKMAWFFFPLVGWATLILLVLADLILRAVIARLYTGEQRLPYTILWASDKAKVSQQTSWQCPSCGAKNTMFDKRCPRCLKAKPEAAGSTQGS
jgi:hypothetical protein